MDINILTRFKTVWLGALLVALGLFVHPYAAYAQGSSQVIKVYPQKAGLDQDIAVTVKGAASFLKQAGCTDGQSTCLDNIFLYLGDIPLKGLTPFAKTEVITATDTSTLSFHLQRTPETKDAWNRILTKPGWKARDLSISVGVGNKPVRSSSGADLKFVIITQGWVIFYGTLLVALLAAFLLLVKQTNLIRDTGNEPGGKQRRPYSLARSQMAWWFFVVVATYLLIGVATGDFATSLSSSVLVLLGISTATALGGAVVDSQKGNSPDTRAKDAEAKQKIKENMGKVETALNNQPKANATNPQGTEGKVASLIATKDLLESQKQYVENASQGWYRDILSDANGISFHRFQMAGWTIVLGIVFVVTVYKTLSMPEFGDTLLTLMGISAGAYIGFKIPEPITPTPAPPQSD